MKQSTQFIAFLESIHSIDPELVVDAKATFEGLFGRSIAEINADPEFRRNRYGAESVPADIQPKAIQPKIPKAPVAEPQETKPAPQPNKPHRTRMDWSGVMANLRAFGQNTNYPPRILLPIEIASRHYPDLGNSIDMLKEPLGSKLTDGAFMRSPESIRAKYQPHIDRVSWWLDLAEKMTTVDFVNDYLPAEIAAKMKSRQPNAGESDKSFSR